MSIFSWLESSALGRTVGESLMLTAWLSAIHLIGFTAVMGGAIVSNGRLAGALLPTVPARGVVGVGRLLILPGLAVSIGSGFALFSARATTVVESGAFDLKMSLLLIAVAVQIGIWRRAHYVGHDTRSMVLPGFFGLTLWVGLALAACWFILFE